MVRLRQGLKDTKLNQAAYKDKLEQLEERLENITKPNEKGMGVWGQAGKVLGTITVSIFTGMAVNALGPMIGGLFGG